MKADIEHMRNTVQRLRGLLTIQTNIADVMSSHGGYRPESVARARKRADATGRALVHAEKALLELVEGDAP